MDLIAIERTVDTTTSTGRLLFGVLAVLTEFEADCIAERAQEGREAARRRGTRLGRSPLLDDEAMKRAHRLHRTGKSHGYIAEQLGVHRTTVLRALRRAS